MNSYLTLSLGFLVALALLVFLCYRYLKPYQNRALICLIPVLLSAWIVSRAGMRYHEGEGGFKLGVDLVGGTILVYEVDTERLEQQKKDNPNTKEFDPAEMAAYLKRRIDPADLYNVTIRPVGKTRFEIILPSGGLAQNEKAERNWTDLLAALKKPDTWQTFFADYAKTKKIEGEQLEKFRAANADVLKAVGSLEKSDLDWREDRDQVGRLAGKIRQEINWTILKERLLAQYPGLKEKADLLGATPMPTAQLVDVLKTPTGASPEDLRKFLDANSQVVTDDEVRRLIDANYQGGSRKGVTTEYVQQVKELIAQQGSLEFRIVANRDVDKSAFRAAMDYFRDKDTKATEKRKLDLEQAARNGQPPPPPLPPEGETWPYTYSWVELGKPERLSLGLSNANRAEGGNSLWSRAAAAREQGIPLEIENPAGGGRDDSRRGYYTMLLWSRKCDDLRLTTQEREEKAIDYFALVRNPISPETAITGDYLVNAQVSETQLEPTVEFVFNARGGRLFFDVTSANLPQGKEPNLQYSQLAIILDGLIVSAPTINSAIGTNGQITGRFSADESRRLAQILRSGALPATLKPQPVSESTIGPTLGADTIRKGVWSVALAFLAVLAFMVYYYRFAGIVACVALLANLLLTIAFMVFVNATFTLPGLAGLVLTLGMAVDANVLIYERLREERERGASLALAIRNGYDHALPTILDTHLTSIFTAIVLYAVGNDQLKGFGISLAAGLIISLFTSLYMTRLMFDLWQARGWLTKLSMAQWLTNFLHRNYIDFMRIRYYWFTATVILTVLGLGIFLLRGRAGLNIDFVGGTAYGGQLAAPLHVEELRSLLSHQRQEQMLQVASVKQKNEAGTLFTITYKDGASQDVLLANNPLPAGTVDERQQVVAKRASILPDWSVEQTFLSSEPNAGGASRFFAVRSTEKESDLVQLMVNRLLTKDNASLMKTTALEKVDVKDREARLVFSDLASPGYVKLLLARSFESAGIKGAQGALPFELTGEGKAVDGRYKEMLLVASTQAKDAKGQPLSGAELSTILNGAKMNIASRPLPERLENFDAQLAAETSRRALYAILLSWAAILLYLWFRFGNWTFGAAAVLCLVHDLAFTLGAIALCHYAVEWVPGLATFLRLEDFKIDLPAVAAMLTLVGYSVNDTIVVFDRIREVRGKNPALTPQMINDSVNQTMSRTLLAALTVWLVVGVLYLFGGEGVHLFAFVMVVGVIVGTYSSIYIASPLLLMFGEGAPEPARDRSTRTAPAGSPA